MNKSFFEIFVNKIELTLYSYEVKTHKDRLFLMEKFLFEKDFQKDFLRKNLIPDSSNGMTAGILACFYMRYVKEKNLN